MSKAMQLVGIILLGIFTLVIVNLINDARSTGELTYYLLQEVTEASMYDAVDFSYYRETGLLKVDRDMFIESFNRRFAQSVTNNRSYNIKIIDFNETPPKVSVEASASTIASVKGEVALVVNRVSGIIETVYDDVVLSVPNYKSGEADENPPVIQLVGKTRVNLSDDISLDKYCLGYVKTGEKVSKDTFKCDSWKNSISGLKSYDLDTTFTYYGDKQGYDKAIAVYDRAGNSSISTIVYNGPAVSCSFGNHNQLVEGNLQIEVSDFYEFKSYSISGGETTITGDFNKVNHNSNIYTASKLISHFYRDYMTSGTKSYTVTVRNKEGYSGSCTLEIEKKNENTPTITYTINKKDGKITFSYSDNDNDITYYALYKENASELSTKTQPEDSSSSWKGASSVGGSITESYTVAQDTAFYVFVKDKYGYVGTSKVLLKAPYKFVAIGCSDDYDFNNNESDPKCTKTNTNYNKCNSAWKYVCPQDEVDTTTCAEDLKPYYTCSKVESYTTTQSCASGYGLIERSTGPECCKGKNMDNCISTTWTCKDGYVRGTNGKCNKKVELYNQTSKLSGYTCSESGSYCPNNNYVKICPVEKNKICPGNNYDTDTDTDNNKLMYGCRNDGSTANTTNQMCEFY